MWSPHSTASGADAKVPSPRLPGSRAQAAGSGSRSGARVERSIYGDWFLALGSTTNDTKTEMIGLASIGSPGIAETLFTGQGFNVVERGASASVLEFADEEIAWQALRSPGLVKPALDSLGDDALRDLLLPAVEQFRAADGSYRIVNELTHVIGQKPG